MTSNFKWFEHEQRDSISPLEFFLINIPIDSPISGQGFLEDPTCIKVTVSKPSYGNGCYDGHFWAFNRGVNILSWYTDNIDDLEKAKVLIENRIKDIWNIKHI